MFTLIYQGRAKSMSYLQLLNFMKEKEMKKELYNKIIPFCNSGILKNFANFWPREAFSY